MHFNLLGLTTTLRTFTQHFPPPGTIELSSSIEKRSPPREKNVTWSWGKNLREERGGHRARPTSRGAPVAGGSPPGGRQLGVGFVGKRLPVCATALSKDYCFNFIIKGRRRLRTGPLKEFAPVSSAATVIPCYIKTIIEIKRST